MNCTNYNSFVYKHTLIIVIILQNLSLFAKFSDTNALHITGRYDYHHESMLKTIPPIDYVSFYLKAVLQGAEIGTNEYLMRDDLRKKNLIPLADPYNSKNQEKIKEELLQISGKNGIVDWILVELRDANNLDSVVAARSLILQRDGDIVDTDGNEQISFPVKLGNYHIAVNHRNHISVMTRKPVTLSPTPAQISNFNTKKNNIAFLPFGDLNGDGKCITSGVNSDAEFLQKSILAAPENKLKIANFILEKYHPADLDLNGAVILQGPKSDASNLMLSEAEKYYNNK